MSKTISSSIATGVTLTANYDPLTITAAGTIDTGARAAIYGNATQAWQIYNAGLIDATGSFGIELLAGSTITNTGTLMANASSADGIRINNGAGTIINGGTLLGGFDAIALTSGGSISNTGTIRGAHDVGISVVGGAGTIMNAGSIIGSTSAISFSGTFADRVILDPGAYFLGLVKGGAGTNTLELAAGSAASAGTLNNFATEFTGFGTIAVDAGATWQFSGGNSIGSGVTLTDAGTLQNAGQIETTVTVAGGGSVANTGSIDGSTGITLLAGGTVTNTASYSAIQGTTYGIRATDGVANISNAGTVYGTEVGIGLYAGGTVLNTGAVTGQLNFGVFIGGGAATLTNGGNISTNFDEPDAVYFKGDYADRVILDPGASFGGRVQGGSGSNTLELAAGTAAAAGTLATATYLDFGTVTVDSGARWSIAGPLAGTLANAGTLLTGITLSAACSVQNSGIIDLGGATAAGIYDSLGGTVGNTGVISGRVSGVFFAYAPGSVTNYGNISGGLYGVGLGSGGAVDNFGRIIATSTALNYSEAGIEITSDAGTVTNSGTILTEGNGVGIYLWSGTVTNSGAVTATLGVVIGHGNGTVINSGTIAGGSDAIDFKGSYTDRLIVDPGAVFSGSVSGGSGANTLELAAGNASTGTLGGLGTQFIGFGTLTVDAGAAWQFSSSDSVAGGVTLSDAGTLNNAGQINTTVTLGAGASFANTGTISLPSSAESSVDGQQGGIVDNQGVIMGAGAGVYLLDGVNTITNSGILRGGTFGAYMAGGTLTNSGTLTGGTWGVHFNGAGTVINSGTISGGYYSIIFMGNAAHRLIVDPGAVFSGLVDGLSGTNTLELAEGNAGSTGTFSSLTGGFAGFGTLTVDAGSTWLLASGGSVQSSQVVTDFGTLNNAGQIYATVSLGAGASFSNTGTLNLRGSEVNAIYAHSQGRIENDGLLTGATNGVFIANSPGEASTITNHSVISAGSLGIYVAGGGTVYNTGTITTTHTSGNNIGIEIARGPGLITNSGTIYGGAFGADLVDGGTITNSGGLSGGSSGVLAGANSTVINSGTISGSQDAVNFTGLGGRLVIDRGAVFSGLVAGYNDSSALELAGGSVGTTGTLNGFGTQFIGFDKLTIDKGAAWVVGKTSTIGNSVALTDAGTLANAGVINTTITVSNAASIGNSGTINVASGGTGITMLLGGTVVNSGLVEGFDGVMIGGGAGTVTNSHIIDVQSMGVSLSAGGAVHNSGTIDSTIFGDAVQIAGGAGLVTNTATIAGLYGVVLTGGGTVQNDGTIEGGQYGSGVEISGGAGKLINSGTISGGTFAVAFSGDFADTVVFDAGAVFKGEVRGGSGSNTLELAAGGTSAVGTLSSFASSFVGFGTISVEGGANWQIAASSTIGSGVAVIDSGGLTNAGVIDPGVLVSGGRTIGNSGTIGQALSSGFGIDLVAGGTVGNSGLIEGFEAVAASSDAATVSNSGTISGGACGVLLNHGGTVTNTSSGDVRASSASGAGIKIIGAAGTVTDAGTISGGTLAVVFGGDFADRMILDPGAVLDGEVLGGSGTNTLELAAGTQSAVGTLTGIGSEFPHFAELAVDAGADWTLNAKNALTIASGRLAVSLATGATLSLTGGGALAAAVSGTGTLQLGGTSGFTFAATDAIGAGNTLAVEAHAFVSGSGSIAAAMNDAGMVTASGGTLSLHGALGGAGALDAYAGATAAILGGGIFSGTLGGAGTILAASAIQLDNGAAVSAAYFTATADLALGSGVTLRNTGGHTATFAAAAGRTVALSGATGDSFINSGTIAASGGGTETIGVAFSNTASVKATSGTLAFLGAVTNQGTIDAASGLVSFATSIAATGTLEVGSSGTLSLALGAGAGQIVDFLAGTGLVDLADPIGFHGTITGFGANDRIDLLNTLETSYSYASNVLTVKNGSLTVASLHFTGSSNSFSLASDMHGGTLIEFK